MHATFSSGGLLESNSPDYQIYNGVTTKTNSTGTPHIVGYNATFSGGFNTYAYGYTASGSIQNPAVTLKPTGVTQSGGGYAVTQNFNGAGAVSGSTQTRFQGGGANDIKDVIAVANPNTYYGADPGIINTAGTNESPSSIILESGSYNGGLTYNDGGAGD